MNVWVEPDSKFVVRIFKFEVIVCFCKVSLSDPETMSTKMYIETVLV